ncbi:hypothetical protein Tco_0947878, partial [Tanacetum coccineum]
SSSNNNTSNTNGIVNTAQGVNTANGVSTTSTQVNAAYSTNVDNLSDAVICAFLASQPNSPQLVHEDLQQIHPDDMEEMDLRCPKWSATTATRRDILLGSAELQEIKTTRTRKSSKRIVPVETSTSTALVSCDGLGGYDWSNQAEKGRIFCTHGFLIFKSDSEGESSINTARQVNIAHSKTTVNAARPMSYLSKTANSTVKRPINKNTTFKNSNINQRVNTVRGKEVTTARPKAVVNAVKGNNVNVVKASTCWVWKPKTKVLDHVSK